jgi:tetratricopeptide (TPR) repeat protein
MGFRVCFCLSLALASVALAAPSPADVAEAKRLHNAGASAYRLGHFDEALEQFEASYRLTHFPELLFNVAQLHRKLWESGHDPEHLRRAVEVYRRFLDEAPANAARRRDATVILPPLESAMAALDRRAKVERAAGREGLRIADELLAGGAPDDADDAIAHVLAERHLERGLVGDAWMLRGRVAHRRGQRPQALAAFSRALSLGAVPPNDMDASEPMAEASARLGGATLTLSSSLGLAIAGRPISLSLELHDPAQLVEHIALYHRDGHRDGGVFAVTTAPRDAHEATLDAAAAGARIEYFVVALGAADAELAREGSPQKPLVLEVISPPVEKQRPVVQARPWYRRWWVWTVVGGVATAGLAVGLGVGYGANRATTLHVPLN